MSSNYDILLKSVDYVALAKLDAAGSRLDGAEMADFADIIGVLCGLKPCAFVLKDIVSSDLLEQLGLACDTSGKDHLVYISKSKELAARLAELHAKVWGKSTEFPDEQREIGRLLGYPATATEYYLRRLPTVGTPDELSIVELPGVENSVREYFYQIVLSPEHHQAEVAQYCEPLEQAVRTLTPKTYRKMERSVAKERRRAI